jgi:hypothetical protein
MNQQRKRVRAVQQGFVERVAELSALDCVDGCAGGGQQDGHP